jgi:hypothetical protein
MSDERDDPAAVAAWLERVRQSGIRIDREGRFIHEAAEVTHEGLRRALFRWLDRLPFDDSVTERDRGRYVLRLDERRFAYLDVDDTPLVARAARADESGVVWLALSDGAEERLDPDTLTVDGQGILRSLVRNGRLEARLASSAAAALADLVSEGPGSPPGLEIRVAGRKHPIRAREG